MIERSRTLKVIGLVALVGAIAVGAHTVTLNYLVAHVADAAMAQPAPSPAAPAKQPLYFQDPSGRPYYAPGPKKDTQGRDYVPVYEETDSTQAPSVPRPQTASPSPPAASGARGKILYYRNPMGLPDTSPGPKKDPMGMDYLPVYESEANEPAGTVTVSPERVQMLGVRTEVATARSLTRSIRAVGTIAINERQIAVVAPRFEGWIEKLLVNTTGQPVRRGQPLFEVYSPDLALAEQEYVLARQAGPSIADATLTRLRNFGLPADEIARLKRSGVVSKTLTLGAPIDGVVLEKNAVEGMHFAPGDTLYRIADLSTVWLLADVFEQDLALVRPGEAAKLSIAAYPDKAFEGKVTFVYPTVAATTRTAKVRIEIPNPNDLLKPDMYANVEIAAPVGSAPVVAVQDSAVLDSGTRRAVLVDRGEGRFEPRPVTTGRRADGYVEIRDGLQANERVVIGANFLIDAESNLRAALQAFTAPAPQQAPKP
jgi:membrane fusion protein, copper/silver efflux system